MQLDIFYAPISCVDSFLLDNATSLLGNNDFQTAASQCVVVIIFLKTGIGVNTVAFNSKTITFKLFI